MWLTPYKFSEEMNGNSWTSSIEYCETMPESQNSCMMKDVNVDKVW